MTPRCCVCRAEIAPVERDVCDTCAAISVGADTPEPEIVRRVCVAIADASGTKVGHTIRPMTNGWELTARWRYSDTDSWVVRVRHAKMADAVAVFITRSRAAMKARRRSNDV